MGSNTPARGSRERVIVGQKASAIHFAFGFLALAGSVGLIRGHLGATTTAGRVALDVVIGVLLLAILAVWEYIISHPVRLEVIVDTITLVGRNGSRSEPLRRGDGELYFLMTGSPKARTLVLCATGTTARLALPMFDRSEVADACIALGWQLVKG